MRAITVRQPWAWAIIHGGKTVENRSRNIAGGYRGPVAIHAGLREDDAAYDHDLIKSAFAEYDDSWTLLEELATGAFIGIANLWAVHQARPGCCPNRGAAPYGSPWSMSDHWHLLLASVQPLPKPIPARGRLGLWTPDDNLLNQLQEALR